VIGADVLDAEIGEEVLHRFLIARVLADTDDAELAVDRMACGQLVERRQLLDAGAAPGRPQVDQGRHALELGNADVAAVRVLKDCRRGGLAGLAAVDALLDEVGRH